MRAHPAIELKQSRHHSLREIITQIGSITLALCEMPRDPFH